MNYRPDSEPPPPIAFMGIMLVLLAAIFLLTR
jgi:hypothetical protein